MNAGQRPADGLLEADRHLFARLAHRVAIEPLYVHRLDRDDAVADLAGREALCLGFPVGDHEDPELV